MGGALVPRQGSHRLQSSRDITEETKTNSMELIEEKLSEK